MAINNQNSMPHPTNLNSNCSNVNVSTYIAVYGLIQQSQNTPDFTKKHSGYKP